MQSSSPEERVDGRNLVRANHDGGRFEQINGGWTEYGADGRARFRFEETGRDDWSVYLIDRSRSVALQLDVHRQMIALMENGRRVRDLYPITETASAERGDYVQRMQQRQARERQDRVERVDGGNLSRVDFAGGRFEQGRDGWTEYGLDGRTRFRFEETGRDEWSVYLLDRSRKMALQLDVHRRMVTWSVDGAPRADLYPITGMESSRRSYPQTMPSGTAIRGSFYRQQGRPEVMFQFADTYQCHVQNPSQMSAYGGFNRVQVVQRLAMRGEFTGACGWPNGFYRRTDQPAVYRLFGAGSMKLGRFACHVVDPRQMALYGGFGQVATVEQSSDLFRGREQPTECPDP